jgi:hypothetical protein
MTSSRFQVSMTTYSGLMTNSSLLTGPLKQYLLARSRFENFHFLFALLGA